MRELLRKHHISFKNAIAGILWAVRTQPNFRIHIICSIAVLCSAWYFEVSRTEVALLVFAIVLGLGAEMINTALESMTDLITKEWRNEAKIAKDVAAGMMLLVAVGAVLVGLVILVPYASSRFGWSQ
ncbi:diacylglycerol kinase family protein [Candidatus Gottesmanbacteria bacterium]|nr:diacylglycerol kinase family protein [Candidatus Gottesmanbacteria bacterium]